MFTKKVEIMKLRICFILFLTIAILHFTRGASVGGRPSIINRIEQYFEEKVVKIQVEDIRVTSKKIVSPVIFGTNEIA